MGLCQALTLPGSVLGTKNVERKCVVPPSKGWWSSQSPVEEMQEWSVQQRMWAGPQEGALRTEASERWTGLHQVGRVGRMSGQRGQLEGTKAQRSGRTLGAWRNEDWKFPLSNTSPENRVSGHGDPQPPRLCLTFQGVMSPHSQGSVHQTQGLWLSCPSESGSLHPPS